MIYSTVGIRGIALTVGRFLNGQDCNVFNVLNAKGFLIHRRTPFPLPRFDRPQQLVRDISFYLKLGASSRKQQRRLLISDLPIIESVRDERSDRKRDRVLMNTIECLAFTFLRCY